MKKLLKNTLVTRVIAAFIVTIISYNPLSGDNSLIEMYLQEQHRFDPVWMFIMVLMVVVHMLFLTAMWKAMGPTGTVLFFVVLGFFVFMLVSKSWLTLSGASIQWLCVLAYSALLGFGTSFAILWRRATGQMPTYDLNEVNDDDVESHKH